MLVETDDMRGDGPPSPHGVTKNGSRKDAPVEERAACAQAIGAFPNEADTLISHGPMEAFAPVDAAQEVASGEPPSVIALDEDDIIEDDDDPPSVVEPSEAEDATSPTLSLAQRSVAAREVYRLFLASDYAPALELADAMIAQGENDPMLLSIARECRSSLSGALAPPPLGEITPRVGVATEAQPVHSRSAGRGPNGAGATPRVVGTMTLEEIAAANDVPVDLLVGHIEQFLAARAHLGRRRDGFR
ncbi:MAG TPA: hypothetical protein VM580_29290 [Labilithrix sp.]|jgi:hypothetical protein|nr:hypothetical protein [Labilithrix sp.]